MKNGLFILLLFLTVNTFSTNYYVSNSGNDNNSGVSRDVPWASLNKVNSWSFKPGDVIYLRRGSSWNETLTFTSSGTVQNPIIITPYGTGSRPRIYGSDIITSNWIKHSGSIYKTKAGGQISQLFIDNFRLMPARFPNTGWLNVSEVVNTTNFRFLEKKRRANFYAGAILLIKTNNWRLDTKLITASADGSLTLNSPTSYGLRQNQKFILVNKLAFLNGAGEWYYNPIKDTVYVWAPKGNSPANYVVRGSVRSYGIVLSSVNNVYIKNIDVLQQTDTGILGQQSNRITIDNCVLRNSELSGARLTGDRIKFINNKISGSNYIPVSVHSYKGLVAGNNVFNCATKSELGIKGMNGFSYAMSLSGEFMRVEYNSITDVGFMGIVWSSKNVLIRNNYISRINRILRDGGAIYSYSRNFDNKVAGSKVVNNIITNHSGTAAIYLDERTTGVLVARNTISRIKGIGVFGHFSNNCKISHNLIFDCSVGIRISKSYGSKANTITNNTVCNIDTTNDHGYSPQLIVLSSDSIAAIDTVDFNNYYDFHRGDVFRNAQPPSYSYMSFSSWKSTLKVDANSSFISTPLPPGESEKLFVNRTRYGIIYHLNGASAHYVNGVVIKDSFEVDKFSSKIIISTNANLIKQ